MLYDKNEELLADLKQFTEATVSQHTAELGKELRGEIAVVRDELKADIRLLDEKLDTIQEAIGESFTQATDDTTATLQDHEQRLRRLEHKAA